VINRSSVQP